MLTFPRLEANAVTGKVVKASERRNKPPEIRYAVKDDNRQLQTSDTTAVFPVAS